MIDLQQAELIAEILTASYIDKDGRVMFSEFEHFIDPATPPIFKAAVVLFVIALIGGIFTQTDTKGGGK
jgi:hypothetical protein